MQDWILANWDREAFLVVMRRIEILLMNNLQELAVGALRQFVAWSRPEPPSLDASVNEVLPKKLANALEGAGYETLRAAYYADRRVLSRIRGIGDRAIEMIRLAAEAAERGERLPEMIAAADRRNDLQAEFEIDWEYFSTFGLSSMFSDFSISESSYLKASSAMTPTTNPVSTETSLAALLKSIENPDQTVTQIDAEIAKRETELSKLKRLRKLLGSPSSARRSSDNFDSIENQIRIAVINNGPLKPKEIKKLIGVDAAHIGRIVAKSSQLIKLTDGRVQQVSK